MKSVIGFTIISGVLAKLPTNIDSFIQKSLFQDACLSESMYNVEYQSTSYDSFGVDAPLLSFRANYTRTLDESRNAASKIENYPWTFVPECFSTEDMTEPFCVYSDETFASGRGIFIVTTKTLAYAMLEKPAFSNPKALERVNQHANPPFEQHDFPGKGRGLVANKTLHRGDQIFASTALVITDQDLHKLSEPDHHSLLYRGVSSLPPASQTKFWALMGHFNGDAVHDRITTNNFEVYIDGISQQALMPEIAMLNHDCRPNAAYFWDEDTMSHYVHATQTIHPGEEITITYVNNERVRATRMERLETNWGFKCSCSACSAHPSLTEESDARLWQITDLAAILDDWSDASKATPQVALALISLYEQERLYASLSTAYKYAAETYSSFGERWMAIMYARLSVEYSMVDKGFADQDVKEMKRMASQPEMTWSWRKRVALKEKGCGCGHAH